MQCGWSAHRVLATAAAAVAEVAVAPHHRLFSPQDQIVSNNCTTAGRMPAFLTFQYVLNTSTAEVTL